MSADTRSLVGRAGLAVWWLLAVFDAGLLLYLTQSYRWFAHDVPDAATPAAIVVYAIAYVVIAGITAFEIGLVMAIGAGILRQFRPDLLSSRWWGTVAILPGIGLLITMLAWAAYIVPLARIRDTARLDRIEVFNELAEPAYEMWLPPGLADGERISAGLFLGLMLALAYLCEKYLLAWWRVRWPVPLVPIVMIGSVVWVANAGERAQQQFLAAREWRVVAPAQTFPDALGACSALGSGWTLPRPSELQLFLSTRPEAMRTWEGAAWTNTAAEDGHTRAVVVEVAARKSGEFHRPPTGVWMKQEAANRGVSACERDTRTSEPADVFIRQRTRLCETIDSPGMHSTTLFIVVGMEGLAARYAQAGTVCVKRPAETTNPALGGRTYREQHEFSTLAAYTDAIAASCAARDRWPKELTCLTLAAEPLPFQENDLEVTFRLACDHAGRVEGCERYATMMEMRGDAERARVYRERVELYASRGKRQVTR